jgi:hypothetical protein
MKKTLVLALSLCTAASLLAIPAEAKKKKKKPVRIERVAEARYENPSPGSAQTGGVGLNIPTFPSGTGEVFVSVEVHDDANPMAGVRVRWDPDGDGTSDGSFFVCVATEEPVAIPAGVTLDVFPYVGGDQTVCPGGIPTAGTVKVTFSNMP